MYIQTNHKNIDVHSLQKDQLLSFTK